MDELVKNQSEIIEQVEQVDSVIEQVEQVIEQVEPVEQPVEALIVELDREVDSEDQPVEIVVECSDPVDTLPEFAESQQVVESSESIESLSAEQLCEQLATDIQNLTISHLRTRVEQIKTVFYRKVRSADEAERSVFIAQGGDADHYQPVVTGVEKRFKELLTIYREKRDKFLVATEEQKEANHKLKLEIIEELKSLVNSSETLGQTFAAFRELQNRWREIGVVPTAVTKDLWETFHHHTENFYNFIKINKELRDLDLKRNYEAKLSICEQTESLNEVISASDAFNSLQKLHDQYREAGPVSAEFKEQLWERFKAASTRINKRHQEYYDSLRAQQDHNLELKGEICVKVEQLCTLPLTSAKEWNTVQNQIADLQKEWKEIGFAPKRDNNRIYERFRAACDKFFECKRNFFGGLRGEMDDNLQAKTDLCVQAESFADSQQWKQTTEQILSLQKRWKEIGAVSRKHSDIVWKRFRAACDNFFERKADHFKESDNKFGENLDAKLAIIEQLASLKDSEELSFDKLREIMQAYSAIGFVPIRKKESLAKRYKDVCDVLFEQLRAKEGSERTVRFKERVGSLRSTGQPVKMSAEREKLYHRLRQLEGEVKQLENNIGFFGSSKGAAVLIADVEKKIERTRVDIAGVIEKIRIIDEQ